MDLPLFRITCLGPRHPHYGRMILSHDPGYALTTGRCADVGRITLQSTAGASTKSASREEVELAGRGFTPEVEAEYRKKHLDLDFTTPPKRPG